MAQDRAKLAALEGTVNRAYGERVAERRERDAVSEALETSLEDMTTIVLAEEQVLKELTRVLGERGAETPPTVLGIGAFPVDWSSSM